MKVLTKGIFYYKAKGKQTYVDQGLPEENLDAYINDDYVMLWHECHNYKKRAERTGEESPVRVGMKCLTVNEDVSNYECAYCGFAYSLDNHLSLVTSKL